MGKQHFKLTAVEQLNITYQGNVPLEKRLRKALFILTLHSKLYADKKGVIELSDYDFMLINKGDIKEDLSSSSLANVEVRMRDLEQLGKLVIVEHSGGDYKKPNKYRLLNNAEANSRIKELTVCSDRGPVIKMRIYNVKQRMFPNIALVTFFNSINESHD